MTATALTPQWLVLSLVFLLTLSTAACDGAAGANGDAPSRSLLTISFAADGATTGSLVKAAKSRSYTDSDGNTLEIETVEMILREIEFEREDDDLECGEADDDDDSCEKVEAGPLLIELPLDAEQPTVALEASLPEGRWEEVEFEVHKLDDDDSDDRALLEETGFPEDASIRVTGTWTPSGDTARAFTYTSDLNEDQEIEFEPPVEVTAEAPKNVTFTVNLDTWFRDGSEKLINPELANDDGPYEDLVEDNIENSIEGFEDDDRDGDDDDDGDGDDDDDSDD